MSKKEIEVHVDKDNKIDFKEFIEMKIKYDDEYFKKDKEIERLKEIIEDYRNKEIIDFSHKLDESWYKEDYEKLNHRINKAIEYIKKHGDYNKSSGCIEELDLYKINELLEILEGSDEISK